MDDLIGTTHVEQFVDQGFLVVPGLVSAEDLTACRAELLRFARGGYQVSNGVQVAPEVAVEVVAGDVVFFNGYPLHRSLKNRSDRFRRALVNHYCSGLSSPPWLVDAGIDIGAADSRKVATVHGDDPYPERPIESPPTRSFLRPVTQSAGATWVVHDR